MQKRIKGFTLLEILLVIAVIGILAAIVLIAINPNKQLAQARNAERRVDLNTLNKSLEQILIDTGSYPAGITDSYQEVCATENKSISTPLTDAPSVDCTGKLDLRSLIPTYIAAIPRDPQSTGSSTGYYVARNSNNNRISIKSTNAELSQSLAINDTGQSIGSGGDVYYNNVSLLLHMENGYTDSSPNNISVTPGTPTTFAYDPYYKFGAGSVVLNNTTDAFVATHPTAFAVTANEDYTIEFWLKPSSTGGFQYLVYCYGSLVIFNNSGGIRVEQNGGNFGLEGGSFVVGQWYHIATTKSSGTMRLFVDGVLVSTTTSNTTASNQTNAGLNPGPFRSANGTIVDEIRFTKGVARYTSNFTPPTAQFPDSFSSSPPTAPTGLAINNIDNNQITLTWNSSLNSEITNYVIQYSSDNGATWTTSTNPVSSLPRKTVQGLINGSTYLFRVAGVNANGTGSYSAPTSAYTLPGLDTYYANTPTLLHFDGSNGSTTFTNSGNTAMTFTPAGGASISTSQSQLGGASGLLNGTNAWIQAPYSSTLDFDGAFTFEGYFRLSSLPGSMILYSRAQSTWGIPIESAFYLTSPTNVNLYYGTRGSWMQLRSFTLPQTLVTNQWYHIAITRDSNSLLRVWLDGISSSNLYTDNINLSGAHPLYIGAFFDGSSLFNGNLDEFRFTKGVARYTAPFVPPIAPFANN